MRLSDPQTGEYRSLQTTSGLDVGKSGVEDGVRVGEVKVVGSEARGLMSFESGKKIMALARAPVSRASGRAASKVLEFIDKE